MADVLPGYSWDSRTARYRSSVTGRYVARRDILSLMEAQVSGVGERMAELTTALIEGRLSPAVWEAQARSELKRQHLAQSALGSGGFDRLGAREFGRVGGRIRQDYAALGALALAVTNGEVTPAQALARANRIMGNARTQFFDAERDRIQRSASNRVVIERRVLGAAAQHCSDCVGFYNQGWQLAGSLPSPGVDAVCGGNCRCSMMRREVSAAEVNQWLGTKN